MQQAAVEAVTVTSVLVAGEEAGTGCKHPPPVTTTAASHTRAVHLIRSRTATVRPVVEEAAVVGLQGRWWWVRSGSTMEAGVQGQQQQERRDGSHSLLVIVLVKCRLRGRAMHRGRGVLGLRVGASGNARASKERNEKATWVTGFLTRTLC